MMADLPATYKVTDPCSFLWSRQGNSAGGTTDQQQRAINKQSEIQ